MRKNLAFLWGVVLRQWRDTGTFVSRFCLPCCPSQNSYGSSLKMRHATEVEKIYVKRYGELL